MFEAVETNVGHIIADGTSTRKVARAAATLAGISNMGIWDLSNHGDDLRERVAVISPTTLRRIQRHPDPEIDYEITVGRIYDIGPTNRYIVRVNSGVDLSSFENIGELLKQSERNSFFGKLRSLWSRVHFTIDAANGKNPNQW